MFRLNRFDEIFNNRFEMKFETIKGESILEIKLLQFDMLIWKIEIEKKSLHFGFFCNLIISNKIG